MKSEPFDPDVMFQRIKHAKEQEAKMVVSGIWPKEFRGIPVPPEKTSENWKPPKYDSGYRKRNLERIESVQLDHTEELSPAGDTLWGLIRRELELEWTNGFWLPRTGLPQEKHDLLFDAADWLLNTPSDPDSERGYYLPDNDLRILVDRLRSAINRLREQLAQESWNPWKTEQEQTATVKDIEIIPEDALLKIQTPAGLDKLKALFADLETQGMVAPGTTETIGDHFTESAKKDRAPEGATPIEWVGRKFEGVHLLKTLIAQDWLSGNDDQISSHIFFEGKRLRRTGYPVRDTEDLSRIKEILTLHLR